MELNYVMTEEELGELHVRAHFRRCNPRRERLNDALWGSGMGTLALVFVMKVFYDRWPQWWLYLIVIALMFWATFHDFRQDTANRISKGVRKDYKDKTLEVAFRIAENKLHVLAQDVENIFLIKDILWVSKDEAFLEVSLGDKAYIGIPIRVFENEALVSDFIKALGVDELKDHSEDKGMLPLPKVEPAQGGIKLSALPWVVGAVASTLLGIITLVASSHAVGLKAAFNNPLGYIAMGMIAFGVLASIALWLRRKPQAKQ